MRGTIHRQDDGIFCTLSSDVFTGAPRHKKRARLSLKPLAVINAPCVIRTHDRLLRRQLLYPAELREHLLILTVDVRHPP